MYHTPVLLKECVKGLNIKPGGIYVDLTFGGGGHSRAVLQKMEGGKLIVFDQDADAMNNKIEDDRVTFIHQNFKYLYRYLKLHNAIPVDGIFADLGVSSHQLDTPERGFSTRFEGPLDMRMDVESKFTAFDVINNYDSLQLKTVFSEYGQIRNSKSLAERIVLVRKNRKIDTTSSLKEIAGPLIRGNPNRYLAQLFQAIRMEVNEELKVLKEMLPQSLAVLNNGGRIVILSYHSIEDRMVKHFFKYGNTRGVSEQDIYGNEHKMIKPVTKKPTTASEKEIKKNPRAGSAKLRIAEKIAA